MAIDQNEKLFSDLHLEDLFANTSDLIHFANSEEKITNVNPAWLAALDYTFDEVVGTSIYKYIEEKDRLIYDNCKEESFSNAGLNTVQITLKRKDGRPVIVEGSLKAYFSGNKRLYTRGLFQNKTRIPQHYDERFFRLNNFIENAPDAVVVINQIQSVIEWNLKAEKIFGYTKSEALSKRLSELIIPYQYREAHERGLQHFLNTGEGPVLNKTIEVRSIYKYQRQFPISLSISNVKLDNEWFFIAFIEDISEAKNQQEEQIRQQIELNKVKYEDQKIKDFLNIASHELKTPLTSIKALTQLALRGIGKHPIEQSKDYLVKIDQSSNKIKKLILDLLDISKLHAGKLIVELKPVNYSSFLSKVIDTCGIIFTSHRIDITNLQEIEIAIDSDRIEQVITNLISNAVKYSPDSGLVEVSTKKTNEMLITAVKDYGLGIDIGNQHKVFEKFFQIDELQKTDKSGFGMGLYICSEIIKQHRGSIWVESNEGKGATFYFALPLKGY